ncbi:MAG: YCF48-related protein, partial [Gemmatimonadota bacterium]|nr:YCF48-related protein [Gemmatimonadota bacterium]
GCAAVTARGVGKRRLSIRFASSALITMGLLGVSAMSAWGQDEDRAEPNEIEYSLDKPLAVRSLLLDGAAVEGLMVAVGERGHVLMSRDDGATWRQARVPTRASLTGVYFHDDQLGWAVGHDAVIIRTRDGGENWERLHFAPEEERPFLDVWFSDADNGFVIGAYGYFLKTSDGGDSWTDFEIAAEEEAPAEDYYYDDEVQYHLNAISVSDSGALYIAAEAGHVYRSDDGGETWVSLPSPYEGSYFGTLPLEGDSLLLYGLRGHLFRSDDAGETWQELETGTQALLTDATRLDSGTIVIVGLAGTALVSTDGGHSFILRQQADREGLTTLLSTDSGDVVVVGEFGVNRVDADEFLGSSAP